MEVKKQVFCKLIWTKDLPASLAPSRETIAMAHTAGSLSHKGISPTLC